MTYINIEYSKAAYRADFATYGILVTVLAYVVFLDSPAGQNDVLGLISLAGLASWTLIEYGLHRVLFHGVRPFSLWHGEHHRRPMALIGTPTLITMVLFALLIYLPARALGGAGQAAAYTLGVLLGYLAYSITHHALHHWHFDFAWLKQRQRWHALHHHRRGAGVDYGVTTSFWDHVFGTKGQLSDLRQPAEPHLKIIPEE